MPKRHRTQLGRVVPAGSRAAGRLRKPVHDPAGLVNHGKAERPQASDTAVSLRAGRHQRAQVREHRAVHGTTPSAGRNRPTLPLVPHFHPNSLEHQFYPRLQGGVMFTVAYWKATAERAAKSAAQALLGLWVGDQLFNAWTADYVKAGGVALGAAILSVLTSLVSANFGKSNSPSLTGEE